MKKYKCPNCKREVEAEGDTIMIMCGCGYEMVEQIRDNGNIVRKEDKDENE